MCWYILILYVLDMGYAFFVFEFVTSRGQETRGGDGDNN